MGSRRIRRTSGSPTGRDHLGRADLEWCTAVPVPPARSGSGCSSTRGFRKLLPMTSSSSEEVPESRQRRLRRHAGMRTPNQTPLPSPESGQCCSPNGSTKVVRHDGGPTIGRRRQARRPVPGEPALSARPDHRGRGRPLRRQLAVSPIRDSPRHPSEPGTIVLRARRSLPASQQVGGATRQLKFSPTGVEPRQVPLPSRTSNTFPYSADEHHAVRNAVGLFDQSSFGKIRVDNPRGIDCSKPCPWRTSTCRSTRSSIPSGSTTLPESRPMSRSRGRVSRNSS